MPTIERAARRNRLLEDRQHRLAFITGRQSSPPPPPPPNSAAQSPPLLSPNHQQLTPLPCAPADKFIGEAARPSQRSNKESFLHGNEAGSTEKWNISCLEELITNPLNLFGSISSQQLRYVLSATTNPRMAFSITMALLVLMSHFRFPIVGNKIIRSVILFKPLLFLLLNNAFFIVMRLAPERREKGGHIVEGYGWVEEAARVVEVSLVLHDVFKTLFMDFVVYSFIVICGFGFAC